MNSSPPQKRKAARGRDGLANEEVTEKLSHDAPSGTSSNGQREHRGYYMIGEEAERRIERSFDAPCDIRAAKLAYHTLLRVANLRGSHTFEATIGSLSRDMAYPYRDGQRALRLVEGIGLVQITRRRVIGTKAYAPSIYSVQTLLPNVRTSREDGLRGTSPQLSQEHIQSIHTKNV
jgi:hypothetical protein